MKGKFGGMVGKEGDVARGAEQEAAEKKAGGGGVLSAGGWGEKDLEGILMKEEFEKVKVISEGDVLLSQEEMDMLMDRSPEAYVRAAKGEEKSVLGKGRVA